MPDVLSSSNHSAGQNVDTPKSMAFVPLPESTTNTKANPVSSEDFRARAKAFEPAANSLWSIPIGVAVKVIRNKVVKITEDEEKADNIAETIRPCPESSKAAKEATARVLARRGATDDVADGLIIAGCIGEIAHGFYDCLQAIKGLERELIKHNSKE